MKKAIIGATLGVAPFLFIWICFIFTAFSFNPQDVFQHTAFWFIAVIYWIVYLAGINAFLDEFVGDN